MVAWSEGHYGAPFKGFRGVIQGDSLSPTIFNVVVDEVLRHWVTMVAVLEEVVPPVAANTKGFRKYIQRLVTDFYADNGLLLSTGATHIQRTFGTLTELFGRVGLRTNVAKTVSMVCQPCHALGGHLEKAYGICMTGEGLSFWEWLCQRVCCPNCKADLAAG